jgi:hypothetical protein
VHPKEYAAGHSLLQTQTVAAVIIAGNPPAEVGGYSVTSAVTVILPMRSTLISVNHSAPSRPTHSPYGDPLGLSVGVEVMTASGPIRPIRSSPLGEPHRPVGAWRDHARPALRCFQVEPLDHAAAAQLRDPPGMNQGGPHLFRATRAEGDAVRALCRGCHRELSDKQGCSP